jgi:hypothetical protein
MRRPPVNEHWREGDTHLLLDYPRTVSVNTPFRLHLVLPSDPDSKPPKIPKPNNGVLNFVEREEVIIEADKENLWSSELRYVEYVFEAIAHERGDFIIPAFEIDYTFLEGGKHKRKVEELKVHVASVRNDVGSQNRPECRQMLDVATPEMFRINAFRITGLPVDATTREITKHADKLKMMEELGEGKSVHTGALALKTPPTVDQIREAIQRLKDPELRIIDEFFWFWPRQFGKSSSDPAIKALEGGDADAALEIWKALETSPSDGFIAMHNVAVLRHLLALEWENHYAKTGEFTEENRRKTEKLWRAAFKRWDLLATDDLLWESVSARIKQLDDPRLTSGFARRMRATLPHALDKINAELAVRYAESGRMDLAQVHVQFMRETNQGLDNIEKTAELVLVPATARLKQQIQRVQQHAAKRPSDGVNAGRELLEHARCSFVLFDLFFGEESEQRHALSEEIASLCNVVSIAYQKATGNHKVSIELLREALPFATSIDLLRLIEENITKMTENLTFKRLDPVYAILKTLKESTESPSARFARFKTEIVPVISNVSNGITGSEAYAELVDFAACVLREIALNAWNEHQDVLTALAATELGLKYAQNAEIIQRLKADGKTLVEIMHRTPQQSFSNRKGVGCLFMLGLLGCTVLAAGLIANKFSTNTFSADLYNVMLEPHKSAKTHVSAMAHDDSLRTQRALK